MKRYSELIQLKTFKERVEYCKTFGDIGVSTFGGGRWLNQLLYKKDVKWKDIRRQVIIRDEGNDLGIVGRPINNETIIVHHLNPITKEQILNNDPAIYDLENLICCSLKTHNAIHYNKDNTLIYDEVERRPNDTIPWR